MARTECIPKFTVSGKAMQLIMEIAAALERYKVVMEGQTRAFTGKRFEQ